jgi:LysR family pca operon transcriptional activator
LLSAWGVPPLSGFVEVLSVSTGRALALKNDGVWFVPLSAVEYELAHGMLVRLPLPFAGTDEPVGLIRRSDSQPSAVGRALIDAVREVARQRMTGDSAGKAAGSVTAKRAQRATRKPKNEPAGTK